MYLYVSNLGERITEESLRAIFATHGEVRSSRIVKDRATGSSRGFALVEMPDDSEAEKAIEKIHNCIVDRRSISVQPAPKRGHPEA
jgi:RNA recognition motif-containing protein